MLSDPQTVSGSLACRKEHKQWHLSDFCMNTFSCRYLSYYFKPTEPPFKTPMESLLRSGFALRCDNFHYRTVKSAHRLCAMCIGLTNFSTGYSKVAVAGYMQHIVYDFYVISVNTQATLVECLQLSLLSEQVNFRDDAQIVRHRILVVDIEKISAVRTRICDVSGYSVWHITFLISEVCCLLSRRNSYPDWLILLSTATGYSRGILDHQCWQCNLIFSPKVNVFGFAPRTIVSNIARLFATKRHNDEN